MTQKVKRSYGIILLDGENYLNTALLIKRKYTYQFGDFFTGAYKNNKQYLDSLNKMVTRELTTILTWLRVNKYHIIKYYMQPIPCPHKINEHKLRIVLPKFDDDFKKELTEAINNLLPYVGENEINLLDFPKGRYFKKNVDDLSYDEMFEVAEKELEEEAGIKLGEKKLILNNLNTYEYEFVDNDVKYIFNVFVAVYNEGLHKIVRTDYHSCENEGIVFKQLDELIEKHPWGEIFAFASYIGEELKDFMKKCAEKKKRKLNKFKRFR